jgi:GDP-L-fucose synthase
MIRKFLEAREAGVTPVTLWGDGSPTREFLYADDAARGILMAAERYDGVDPVNLGGGNEISIREIAALIAEACGYRGEVRWDAAMPNGQPRRALDVSRAAERIGFRAEVPFADGLRRTIDWYLENRSEIS